MGGVHDIRVEGACSTAKLKLSADHPHLGHPHLRSVPVDHPHLHSHQILQSSRPFSMSADNTPVLVHTDADAASGDNGGHSNNKVFPINENVEDGEAVEERRKTENKATKLGLLDGVDSRTTDSFVPRKTLASKCPLLTGDEVKDERNA